MSIRTSRVAAFVALGLAAAAFGQSVSPEMKARAEARAKVFAAWASEPAVVSAVRAYNSAPPAEARDMTQEKWKSASVLDPVVRSFTRNPLATYLKTRRDDSVSEIFVCAADGTKVAFLSKTTNWSHKGKDKHEAPMKGRAWIGPLEVDESTGVQQLQIGVPVLDDGRPIGSMIVGVKSASLK